MAINVPDARFLSDDVLDALRLRALRGCELGFTEADLANILGVARETVSRWYAAYRAHGLDGLPQHRLGRPMGSGRSLDDTQAAHLQELLDTKQPADLGIAAPLWNRRAVRELIRREYGLALAVRTVGVYLRRWGYTAKRPRRHAKDQDPEEVRVWLEETYPALEKRAQAEGATLWWGDEVGTAADEHPGLGYARVGEPATIAVPDSHIHVNSISAISTTGAVRFMTYTQGMTAALFITFLQRLLRSVPGKIFLIVDRLPAHVGVAVEVWQLGHADRLELFYLPRHAPELNPDEYLNNDLKGQVNAAQLPDSQPELRSHVQAFLQRLVHLPERVRSYFQHPSAQYALPL